MPFATLRGMGLEEVTDWYVTHGWGNATNEVIMNLDTWNSLPQKWQDFLTEIIIGIENDSPQIYGAYTAETTQMFEAAGMKPLTFSDADAKWYVDLFYEKTWEMAISHAPESMPELKALLEGAR